MPNQIAESEKLTRSHRLQAASDAVRAKVIAAMAGTMAEVLLEKSVNNQLFTGYTCEYVPVLVSAKEHKSGDIVTVTLGEFDGERCKAALV